MDAKHCSGCGQDKPIADFYKNRARADGLSTWCVECQRAAGAQSAQRKRLALVDAMGGKCQRCGFSDPRALQIDHVDGNGRIERIAVGRAGFYAKVLDHRERYMLLCANCNQIKKAEQSETVGARVYSRQLPTERLKGIGRGNAPGQRAALARARTAEHQAAAARAKKGTPNPKVAAARKGTKLVDGHWVRPS